MQKLCLDGSTYGYDSPYFICSISLTPFLLIPYATLLFLPSIVRFLSCYYTAQRGLSFIKCKIYSELQILNYTQLLVLSAANVKYFSRYLVLEYIIFIRLYYLADKLAIVGIDSSTIENNVGKVAILHNICICTVLPFFNYARHCHCASLHCVPFSSGH